jgi:hypothetical protein
MNLPTLLIGAPPWMQMNLVEVKHLMIWHPFPQERAMGYGIYASKEDPHSTTLHPGLLGAKVKKMKNPYCFYTARAFAFCLLLKQSFCPKL